MGIYKSNSNLDLNQFNNLLQQLLKFSQEKKMSSISSSSSSSSSLSSPSIESLIKKVEECEHDLSSYLIQSNQFSKDTEKMKELKKKLRGCLNPKKSSEA